MQQLAHEALFEDILERQSSREILGIPISVLSPDELIGTIQKAVVEKRPTVFVGIYAALFRLFNTDPTQAGRIRQSITYPDGAGVVQELHKRGVVDVVRMATTDVIEPVAQLASREQWRVGLYGAGPGVAERAVEQLQLLAPGIDVVAIWDGSGPGPSSSELRLRRLDMVLIGLGAPLQEQWAYDVAMAAGIPAILTCGGLFDFLAGDKRRAPLWVQRAGLEWAFRVLLEPRRLFVRYLFGNMYFVRHARAERLRASADITAGEVPSWSETSHRVSSGSPEQPPASAERGTASVTRI